MFTLGTHFEEMLKRTRPPQERLDKARDLPLKVRNFLQEHEDFETLGPHSRLVGSYAQGLYVGDVQDVDFLVRVPGNPTENEPEAKLVIDELKKALDGLPAALGYVGEAEMDIKRARRSVHVYFQGEDFHIDAVPCVAPDGFDGVIYVPDRGFNTWIPSHPIGYIDMLRDLDAEHGDKVRRLIRLLKHFRDYQMKTRKPKSYWLGALVVHHIRRDSGLDTALSLAELFRDLCDAIYCQYDHLLWTGKTTPNIPDPVLGHNISWNWGRSHFTTFMRQLDDGRKWATKALDSDERATAIEYWQRVFGDEYFPSEVEKFAAHLARVGYPGQAWVAGTGRIVSDRTTTVKTTPVQPTTFHGEEKG